jgi:hypothetical protein
MIELTQYDLPLSERLLISLHNLCATSTNTTKKSEELAQILNTSIDEVNHNLDQYISGGYVAFFCDNEGNRRFFLTNTGTIRVCAPFS